MIVLKTMATDMRNVFSKTASELNELSKELFKYDSNSVSFKYDSISAYVSTDRAHRMVSEFADILVMLVALQDTLQYDCERYEQQ